MLRVTNWTITSSGWLTLALLLLLAACSARTEDLSGDYYLASESRDQQVIVRLRMRPGEPYISCNVEAYDDDGRFVVARQRVTKTCFWEEGSAPPNTVGQVRFWIVDTQQERILGPYRDAQALEAARKAHGVSAALESAS